MVDGPIERFLVIRVLRAAIKLRCDRDPGRTRRRVIPWVACPTPSRAFPIRQCRRRSRFGSAVIPVADVFMIAMFSKPPSGTLRTTWVTPSTYWMTLATFLGAVVIAGLLLSGLIGTITTHLDSSVW